MHVLKIACVSSQRLVRPADDDDFVICRKARAGKSLCCQTNV